MKKNLIADPYIRIAVLVTALTLNSFTVLFAQANLKPWGNLEGAWLKGQLMEFNTNVNVIGNNWSNISSTGKEKQKPQFSRDGNRQIVTTALGGFKLTETAADEADGTIKLTISVTAQKDTTINGIYLGVALKKQPFAASVVKIDDKTVILNPAGINNDGNYLSANCKSLIFKSFTQNFSIGTDIISKFLMRPDSIKARGLVQIYLPVYDGGPIKKGDVFEQTFYIKSSGRIDTSPVNIKLNTMIVGRPFAGLGGNFRLQNPKMDPQVIDYCLKNLRVAFGRVEMPWRNWQPAIDKDPIAAADSGKLDQRVTQSMAMAQRLGKMNMPVIVSAWFPPAWAVIGKPQGRSPEGTWGNPLNHDNEQQIYKSIADYLIYLRDHYQVEASYFSFNESDLGINVRQTGEEHNQLIKNLGACFAKRGLKTTVMLGDNSDATTYRFVYPALADPATKPYIHLVSFHSWRGFDTATLKNWAAVAKKINQPLIVGEGSIDAAGYAYPAYFQEHGYAMEEINLYIRLLSICQPLSILQWQLTSDYSPLIGGGIYGNDSPLRPTWRFFNLKQLASTPANLNNLSFVSDRKEISCAALGNNSTGTYTLHLVNNGAARKVHITGIPARVKGFNVYVTDRSSQMKKVGYVKRHSRAIDFSLGNSGFTTFTTTEF